MSCIPHKHIAPGSRLCLPRTCIPGCYVPQPVPINPNRRDSGDPDIPPPSIEEVLDLTCNTPLTGIGITGRTRSLYRTEDIVTNQRYFCRIFSLQIDDAGDYTITLSNATFTAYITVSRSFGVKWQANGNTLEFTVAADQTGPMTLEVSTLGTYTRGAFDVELECPTSLAAYWKFNEAVSPWNDSVGSYHITFASASVISDIGKISNALKTTAPQANYIGAYTSQLRHENANDGFTLAGWFKTTGTPTNRPFELLHKIGGSNSYGFRFFVTTTYIQVQLYGLSPTIEAFYLTAIPLGVFNFFAVWYDPTDDKCYVQLNQDAPLATTGTTAMLATDTVAIDFLTPIGLPFWLDEVGYWKKALNASERASLYNSGNGVTYPNVPL